MYLFIPSRHLVYNWVGYLRCMELTLYVHACFIISIMWHNFYRRIMKFIKKESRPRLWIMTVQIGWTKKLFRVKTCGSTNYVNTIIYTRSQLICFAWFQVNVPLTSHILGGIGFIYSAHTAMPFCSSSNIVSQALIPTLPKWKPSPRAGKQLSCVMWVDYSDIDSNTNIALFLL